MSMELEFLENGIYLPEIDLWLDATVPRRATWISHGHSDHARGWHERVLGTPVTLRFYRMRLLGVSEPREPQAIPIEYGQTVEWNGAELTAYPAGHILGAAQLLVRYQGERLVYTGDVKLRPPLAGTTAVTIPCDRLIIESTFGLPIYRLLTKEEARERILRFAHECLSDGAIPTFVGYALGRGQEIAHILCEAGIRTAVHGAIAKFIPIYEEAGYGFPGWEPYDVRNTAGKALVVVPTHGTALEARGKNVRIAYVSGWAELSNARARARAEELIPYSDHSDFGELVEMIMASGARRIDVVHGYTEPFSRILAKRGLDARPHRAGARTNVEDAEG
jgi:Cft2 family RNA processing exonuclease